MEPVGMDLVGMDPVGMDPVGMDPIGMERGNLTFRDGTCRMEPILM